MRPFLDGNFVPAGIPEIRFESLHLLDGTTAKIETAVVRRNATVVKMSSEQEALKPEGNGATGDRESQARSSGHVSSS